MDNKIKLTKSRVLNDFIELPVCIMSGICWPITLPVMMHFESKHKKN